MDKESLQKGNQTTLLQKRKRKIPFSNQEILLMLRAYAQHPCSWDDIIDSIKANSHMLTANAQTMYKEGSIKQLKDRISSKISKLVCGEESTAMTDEIRAEIENVRKIEKGQRDKRDARREGNDLANTASRKRNEIALNLESSDSDVTVQESGACSFTKKKKAASEDQDRSDEQNKRKKNRKSSKISVMDLIRQNQEEYHKFITKKVPKLLKALGVSSDSDE